MLLVEKVEIELLIPSCNLRRPSDGRNVCVLLLFHCILYMRYSGSYLPQKLSVFHNKGLVECRSGIST